MGGTTAVAAGSALMANSGLTFATAWGAEATTASFLAFSGGVGLVVLGLGIAGYFAYEYFSNPGGGSQYSGPPNSMAGNAAVTQHDDDL